MAFRSIIPHAFSNPSIRAHAPAVPGVYGISNAHQWIYIGEADDIQHRLMEHLTASGSAIKAYQPTGFSYEMCDGQARMGRRDSLLVQYDPVCNRLDYSAHRRTSE